MKTALRKLRILNLTCPSQKGRPCFISAASGLVTDDKNFYVISDDELSLATFSRDGSPGRLTPLFPGPLPVEHEERKKQKPDLESLLKFDDGLLAVPSGSTIHRLLGVFLKNGQPQTVDFSEIYIHLQNNIAELNIEGSVIRDDQFILLQRGNGMANKNALIILNLQSVRTAIASNNPIQKNSLCEIKFLELGSLNQVPLSFTDAALDKHGDIWFLAAAEATKSTYSDGQYVGAVLGCIDRSNNIVSTSELDCPRKPEGLALGTHDLNFWIVTDADDPAQAAELFEVTVELNLTGKGHLI